MSDLLLPIAEREAGFTSRMPPDSQSIRLVVQHVWENSSGRSSYRLIGYSDEHTYRPVDFDSLDDLLKVFKAALPAFDVSRFPREKQPVSSILFAEVIELSDTTLDTWTQEIERLDVLARHRAGKQITRSQKCARSPVWRKLVSILSLAFTTGPSKKLGDACSHCVPSEYRATTSQRTPFLRQQWSCVSAGN